MKHLIAILGLMFFLLSCKDSAYKEKLVGEWKPVSAKKFGTWGSGDDVFHRWRNITITFESSGNVYWKNADFSEVDTGTYVLNKEKESDNDGSMINVWYIDMQFVDTSGVVAKTSWKLNKLNKKHLKIVQLADEPRNDIVIKLEK